MSGVFMPPRLEWSWPRCRWRGRDTVLEERPERAIERPCSGLQQQVRAALRPLYLLVFGEALADHSIHRSFGQA